MLLLEKSHFSKNLKNKDDEITIIANEKDLNYSNLILISSQLEQRQNDLENIQKQVVVVVVVVVVIVIIIVVVTVVFILFLL